jgi:hypothetical protein
MQILKESLETDDNVIFYTIIPIENLRWILIRMLFIELSVMVLRE